MTTDRAPIVRFVVKHPWLTAAALGTAGAMAAALVVVSGAVPIKASSGHWWITAKFLDFAKVRSVATHSWSIPEAPQLDDEALVLRGAGHYETGCFPCHGGPAGEVPPVMAAMTPPPPELSGRVARWKPEELFSIVKHGIKFTGMPAWPAQQRDDEVWAIVAFLRRMPELDAAAYRLLAYGDASGSGTATVPGIGETPPPRPVREICWRCHSADGTGRGSGAFPSLAGQRAGYLYASLRAFRDRTRFSGIMSEIAARLSDDTMSEVASYYERLAARRAVLSADASAIARGATIAARGIPERDIPACAECHGPTAAPKNPAYPKLATQHARYLRLQLDLLRERRRGGSPNVDLMEVFVHRLRPDEIRDVTLYYAALPGS
jgi:cytochrome c553